MTIWILSNTTLNPSEDLAGLLPLAEPGDVKIFYDEAEIKREIDTHLFLLQKHLDLIVIYWKDEYDEEDFFAPDRYDESFIDWIRASDQEYSDNKFNFKSIPVAIYHEELFKKDLFISSFRNIKYDHIGHPGGFGRVRHFADSIGRSIYYWIKRIGDELDRVDLDLSFDFTRSRIAAVDSLGFDIDTQH